MDALRERGAPWPGAVAVSGGSDSLALMHLLNAWARERSLEAPFVLTVDHGLQPGSSAMARRVLALARAAGLKAHSLAWKGEKPGSDIEASAREARYRLMGGWLRSRGIKGLYLAHTKDDQAETFLLRLGRGSGLDGLSAMRPISPYPLAGHAELSVVRPLLSLERERLREHLRALGQDWVDDPMNADPRFGRARIRAAWPALVAIGLEKSRLADAAAHLARAREALDWATLAVVQRACRFENGSALLDAHALSAAPREVALRALARILAAIGGQAYRPRFERLERLLDRIEAGKVGGGCTLHGCQIAAAPKRRAVFGRGTLLVAPERGRKAR